MFSSAGKEEREMEEGGGASCRAFKLGIRDISEMGTFEMWEVGLFAAVEHRAASVGCMPGGFVAMIWIQFL